MNLQISPDVARLFEQAQHLSDDDRMQLAGLLAEEAPGPPQHDTEPLADIVRRRVAEIKAGSVPLGDWDELMQEMERRNEEPDA